MFTSCKNLPGGLAMVLLMAIPAMATITSIKSDACDGCGPTFVQPVVRGVSRDKVSTMIVFGQSVETSTAVEVSGSGVSARYDDRKGGLIRVHFSVSPSAALGDRTVRMLYQEERPDVFKIRVVRGGHITGIKREILTGTTISNLVRSYVEPTSIPVDQPVTLRFSGTSIGNAKMFANSNIAIHQRLDCTETECEFRLTFKRTGNLTVNLLDISADDPKPAASKFFYSGIERVTVVPGTSSSGSLTLPIPSEIPSQYSDLFRTPVVDIVPHMLGVFRRSDSFSFIDDTGKQFYLVPSNYNLCSDLSGNASRLMTIPNPVWGVTNVGTTNIRADIQVQLRSRTVTLATQTITADLSAGTTTQFMYRRPGDSQIRVHTFLDRMGCFMSPQADKYFEDPSYTVVVDAAGALVESSESNNSRSY
ncbi:MAG: hypothetical protein WBD22_14950 [Pyrinomonadaceae bacterium]